MTDKIKKLNATLEGLERLLSRFEVDMAAGHFCVDYQVAIARLADEFQGQMRELTRAPALGGGTPGADDPEPSRHNSTMHCVSRTRGRSRTVGSTQRRRS